MKQTETKTTKDFISHTLIQTNTALTRFFDTVDRIDRKFYGKRMKFFIWGCIAVLIVAPILDELLGVKQDRITYFSTLVFFIFILIIVFSFVGAWRDDTGNWTWQRAKSRLQTYYETTKDQLQTTKTNSKDENLYKLGKYLFFGGIAWKAFQNLSVFVRKPFESLFSTRLISLRNFERFTNHYYWIALLLGVALIAYLYKKNLQIVDRIKNELRQLFGIDINNTKYKSQPVKIIHDTNSELVISSRKEEHVNVAILSSNSNLFKDFITALHNWNPKGANYEYEYQDRLFRHLRKHLPDANIELEYPIGQNVLGSRGRADIVVNETILIEMKRDSSASAIQRAKGQVLQYSEIWKDKGPVILLLCDYDYEQARLAFTPTMTDLAELKRPALTIVAKPK